MNYSLATADRTTHLKVVVVALIAAILVVAVGIGARVTSTDTETARVRTQGVGWSRPAFPSPTPAPRSIPFAESDLPETLCAPCPARIFYGEGAAKVGGVACNSLPVKSTGPVGAPVGEPPSGSRDTA